MPPEVSPCTGKPIALGDGVKTFYETPYLVNNATTNITIIPTTKYGLSFKA